MALNFCSKENRSRKRRKDQAKCTKTKQNKTKKTMQDKGKPWSPYSASWEWIIPLPRGWPYPKFCYLNHSLAWANSAFWVDIVHSSTFILQISPKVEEPTVTLVKAMAIFLSPNYLYYLFFPLLWPSIQLKTT